MALALAMAVGVGVATSSGDFDQDRMTIDGPEHTWGVSGSDFAVYYGLGIAASWVIIVVVHMVLDRTRIQVPGDPAELPTDPVEIAYLAGGSAHAAFIAHLSLYDRRLIEVPDDVVDRTDLSRAELVELGASRPVRLAEGVSVGHGPGSGGGVDLHPVERRVLEALARATNARAVVEDTEGSPEMAVVRDDLVARRLLVSPSTERLSRWAAMAPALVFLVGVARLAAEIRNDRPVDSLLLFMGFAMCVFVLGLAGIGGPTQEGKDVLNKLRGRSLLSAETLPRATTDGYARVLAVHEHSHILVPPALAAALGFPYVGQAGAGGDDGEDRACSEA